MLISQLRNFVRVESASENLPLSRMARILLPTFRILLPKCRSNRCQSYRTSLELINNGTKYLIVDPIQSVTVNIQRFQCISSYFHIRSFRNLSPEQNHVHDVTRHWQYGEYHDCAKQSRLQHLHHMEYPRYWPSAK